jgi:8-oxo-dGTP pyrophosphatase MutT (NUDIX family)
LRQDAVVIIPTIKNKIAIIKQRQPQTKWFYSLPSGRMDKKGESPKKAALRELLEETGMKPKSIRLWKTYYSTGKVINTVYVFIAQNCEIIAKQNLDDGEKIKVNQYNFDEFLELSDKADCFYGVLTEDILKARIHPKLKNLLKKQIFGKMSRAPKNGTLVQNGKF